MVEVESVRQRALALLRKVVKAVRVAADPRFRRALRHGVAPGIEHVAALRRLDVATVIDVGANRGQFTLLAAALFPHARILAFEPLRAAFAKLQAVTAPLPRVERFNLGIARAHGEATVNVTEDDDSSSLLPLTDLQVKLFPGTAHARSETVRVGPLDDMIPHDLARPVLLKIDVQGYELDVLESAPRLLEQVDLAYVEASFVPLYQGQPLAQQIIDHLHANGLRLSGVFNTTYSEGLPIQADLLFARQP